MKPRLIQLQKDHDPEVIVDMDRELDMEKVWNAISRLSVKEQKIIRARLNGLTFKEIGEKCFEVPISGSRVSFCHERAVGKLAALIMKGKRR